MLLPQHIVCIQYAILFFSFCQQWPLLRTIKEIKCTLPTTNTVYSAALITACSHNENAKTGYSFCYALFFMAESEGLGSLRSPASLLRKLSYYRLLLTRLRLAKDCKGSNPLLSYQQKNKGYSKRYTLYSWRRARDSNPRTVLGGYTISNRAPSTSSDNSP